MLRIILFISVFLLSCNQGAEKSPKQVTHFTLNDFYSSNPSLDQHVDEVFNKLSERDRIGQMIVTSAGTIGKPASVVEKLINQKAIGGVLMLGGDKELFMKLGARFDSLAEAAGSLPIIYSSDAEPSLFNLKIKGTPEVPKTIDLNTEQRVDSVARIISSELLSLNIHHNFAPVLDMSPNNEAITNRTFGTDSSEVVRLASAFVKTSQKMQVAATAKHFPGHGLVSGDTHNQLVTIDGEMKEVANYIPMIDGGVISIMVGHIAVINNEKYQTNGLPSSCSRVIVTDLLKNEMNFKGIVVTDAMNMGALSSIENASLEAVKAGCDMILMEPRELKLHDEIFNLYQKDKAFQKQVDTSVKKILRLKACLNLI